MGKNFWDARFEEDAFPWGEKESELARIAAERFALKEIGKVLDVGCGSGRDVIFLAKKGFKVTGIDASPLAKSIAERNAKENKVKALFLNEKIQDSTIEPESFEGVLSYNTLHLFEGNDLEQAVKKIAQLLKPKGLLFLATFSDKEKSSRKGRPVQYFKKKELTELFKPFFKIIELTRKDFSEEHDKTRHTHREWFLIAEKN